MAEPATDTRPLRGLRQAAWLIASGLLVQIVTLIWSHPTAFVLFLGVGAALVAAGTLRFLLVILR